MAAYKRRSGPHALSVLDDLGGAALHNGHTTVGGTWRNGETAGTWDVTVWGCGLPSGQLRVYC